MRLWPPLPCPACLLAAADPEGLCRRCWRSIKSAPSWSSDDLVALGVYRGKLGRVVRAGKFRPDRHLLRALGRHLATRVKQRWPEPQRWLPIPLPSDPTRRRQRGIDHVAEIVAGLSPALGALATPVGALVRRRQAPTQSTRNPHDRAHNVAFSMRWEGPPPQDDVALLLVDDVLTSGASAREAYRALHIVTTRRPRMAVVATADRPLVPPPHDNEP